MAATDPQSLMTQGSCFACYGASTYEIMKLALLAQISLAHNPDNNTDPVFLISEGRCYECFGQVTIPQLMILVLLNQIAS